MHGEKSDRIECWNFREILCDTRYDKTLLFLVRDSIADAEFLSDGIVLSKIFFRCTLG